MAPESLCPSVAGPIDPQWPHPGVRNLRRAYLESERTAQRQALQIPDDAPLDTDFSAIYLSGGEIGGLTYLEVVTGAASAETTPLPLIVLLHGRGSLPTVPAGYDQLPYPARIFIPRAPHRLGNGFTWLSTWSLSPDQDLFQRSLKETTDSLREIIEEYAQSRPTLGRPVLAGFSQGGILAWTLAVRFPGNYDAAFPVAAWIPESLIPGAAATASTLPRIHAIHGTDDRIIPIELGRRTVDSLRTAGWYMEWSEYADTEHIMTEQIDEQLRALLSNAISLYYASETHRDAEPNDAIELESHLSFGGKNGKMFF